MSSSFILSSEEVSSGKLIRIVLNCVSIPQKKVFSLITEPFHMTPSHPSVEHDLYKKLQVSCTFSSDRPYRPTDFTHCMKMFI